MVWLGTCIAAILLGLDLGLAAGLGVELLSVVLRAQLSVSGHHPVTFFDSELYLLSHLFSFCLSLYFSFKPWYAAQQYAAFRLINGTF